YARGPPTKSVTVMSTQPRRRRGQQRGILNPTCHGTRAEAWGLKRKREFRRPAARFFLTVRLADGVGLPRPICATTPAGKAVGRPSIRQERAMPSQAKWREDYAGRRHGQLPTIRGFSHCDRHCPTFAHLLSLNWSESSIVSVVPSSNAR